MTPPDAGTPSGAIWMSFIRRRDLLLVTADPKPEMLASVDAGARLHALVLDRGQLWGIDYDGNAIECRAESGELLARMPVAQGPNHLAVGPEAVWVNHRLSSLASTVIARSDFSVDHVDLPGWVFAVTPEALWLWQSRHFDDATLVRLDRGTSEERRIVSGQNIGSFLVRDDCVWVAAYPTPDRLSVLSLDGSLLREAAAPVHLSSLRADPEGVVALHEAAQASSAVVQFHDPGQIARSVTVPYAYDVALAPTTIAVATGQRPWGEDRGEDFFIDVLDRVTLAVIGRVRLPDAVRSLAVKGAESRRDSWS